MENGVRRPKIDCFDSFWHRTIRLNFLSGHYSECPKSGRLHYYLSRLKVFEAVKLFRLSFTQRQKLVLVDGQQLEARCQVARRGTEKIKISFENCQQWHPTKLGQIVLFMVRFDVKLNLASNVKSES